MKYSRPRCRLSPAVRPSKRIHAHTQVEMLKELMAAYPDNPPRVNQVELHPYLAQPELVAFCKEHGIALMAYSPLGSADSYSGASFPQRGTGPFECPGGGSPLLRNEVVAEVAARRGLTPAQVLVPP